LHNPENKKFLIRENNFLKQNSQHRECKTGDSGKTGKETARDQKINTMELM